MTDRDDTTHSTLPSLEIAELESRLKRGHQLAHEAVDLFEGLLKLLCEHQRIKQQLFQQRRATSWVDVLSYIREHDRALADQLADVECESLLSGEVVFRCDSLKAPLVKLHARRIIQFIEFASGRKPKLKVVRKAA